VVAALGQQKHGFQALAREGVGGERRAALCCAAGVRSLRCPVRLGQKRRKYLRETEKPARAYGGFLFTLETGHVLVLKQQVSVWPLKLH